jgi:putative ABC transport system substrate-binding protein
MKRREFITLLGSVAAGWPVIVRAQQGGRVPLVCILEGVSQDTPNADARYTAFAEGLQQLGWTSGRNLKIEVRWGEGDQAATRKYAAELIALAPDVLVAGGGFAAEVTLKLTHTIPIVFVIVPDPVGSGLVESLSKPGSNATGFMMFEYNLCAKWLELLKEIAPSVTHAVVLRDDPICRAIGRCRGKPNRLARAGPDRKGHHDLRAKAKWRNNPNGGCDRGSECQFDHRSGRTLQAARDLRSTTFCCCRRIDLLRAEFSGPISTRRRVRQSYTKGRKAC